MDCIILVDDGSTDSSGEIADSLAEQFDNITVIHQVNGDFLPLEIQVWIKRKQNM